MLYIFGECFKVKYIMAIGSIVLALGYAQEVVRGRRNQKCRLNMMEVLRAVYKVNITLIIIIIIIVTFKAEGFILPDTSWVQILAPLYFYMTEMLLMAIVSFVVFINCLIQLCCSGSSSRSRLSRSIKDANSEESNNTILSNSSALVRVSLWVLYISVCGLLCLFLVLKNASTLDPSDDSNILSNQGALILLYLGGIPLLTLLFFHPLRYLKIFDLIQTMARQFPSLSRRGDPLKALPGQLVAPINLVSPLIPARNPPEPIVSLGAKPPPPIRGRPTPCLKRLIRSIR